MEMLNKYVKIKFIKKDPSKVERVPENLAFFLGAMFYHKELTNTLVENCPKIQEIELIHKTLYCFSLKKLNYLYKYEAFHFLLDDFVKYHKDELFATHPTIQKASQDFHYGMEFL